jgi:hypothetical protein
MHLLPVTAVSLEEADRAVDLGQTPGDVVVLSFADSDLSTLAAAHKQDRQLLRRVIVAWSAQEVRSLPFEEAVGHTVRDAWLGGGWCFRISNMSWY